MAVEEREAATAKCIDSAFFGKDKLRKVQFPTELNFASTA
jgi:hypothetical protein